MFLDMQSRKAPEFGKDTVYRLKNSTHIDWKRFRTLLSARIIAETIEPLTSESRRNTSLTENEVIQLNGKRWDIEVFFKTCTSVLRLTKECRSLATPHNGRCGFRRIFCPNRAVWKMGNTSSIPAFSILSLEPKSLAESPCPIMRCCPLSYDAMCAQTAIVFTRYLFLAVGVREDSDRSFHNTFIFRPSN